VSVFVSGFREGGILAYEPLSSGSASCILVRDVPTGTSLIWPLATSSNASQMLVFHIYCLYYVYCFFFCRYIELVAQL
jgi:hypothetical protein